jgi:hypothetical protein
MDSDKTYPGDELIPSQWLDRTLPCFTDVPERRLLVAVLMDAIRCLQGVGRPRTEVLSWIGGEYATARIPFQSLCDGLEMEAAPLRRRLLLPVIPGRNLQRRVRVQARSGRMRIVEHTSRDQPLLPAMPIDPVSTAIVSSWPEVA